MGRKKKILKNVKGFEEQIEKHKKKLKEYEGKNYALIGYWKKEIESMEKQLEEEKDKLEK